MNIEGKTIYQLTDNQRLELRYNSASDTPTYDFVEEICTYLNKAGYTVDSTKMYNQDVSSAIARFQNEVMNVSPSGVLNDSTLGTLITYANANANNIIIGGNQNVQSSSNSGSSNPHFNTYFNEENYKLFRKNRQNIRIVFGNSTITKTIVDCFIRSQSVEVDTSGNPIFEVYEFIARDIKESDEFNDLNKYIEGVSDITTSSDIQYKYNRIFNQ